MLTIMRNIYSVSLSMHLDPDFKIEQPEQVVAISHLQVQRWSTTTA